MKFKEKISRIRHKLWVIKVDIICFFRTKPPIPQEEIDELWRIREEEDFTPWEDVKKKLGIKDEE